MCLFNLFGFRFICRSYGASINKGAAVSINIPSLRDFINNSLLSAFCLLPTAHCPLLSAFCPLLSAFCFLPSAFCPLLTDGTLNNQSKPSISLASLPSKQSGGRFHQASLRGACDDR